MFAFTQNQKERAADIERLSLIFRSIKPFDPFLEFSYRFEGDILVINGSGKGIYKQAPYVLTYNDASGSLFLDDKPLTSSHFDFAYEKIRSLRDVLLRKQADSQQTQAALDKLHKVFGNPEVGYMPTSHSNSCSRREKRQASKREQGSDTSYGSSNHNRYSDS